MSPDVIWLCFVLAAGALLAWAWIGANREDRRRFQQTAADAAREPITPPGDVACTKEERDAFNAIVAAEYPAHIPHQTRRTEEDR